jgi:hypothetical protein
MKMNFHGVRGVFHPGGRPLRIVVDADGEVWLCEKDVDETEDLERQGCWRGRDVEITTSD